MATLSLLKPKIHIFLSTLDIFASKEKLLLTEKSSWVRKKRCTNWSKILVWLQIKKIIYQNVFKICCWNDEINPNIFSSTFKVKLIAVFSKALAIWPRRSKQNTTDGRAQKLVCWVHFSGTSFKAKMNDYKLSWNKINKASSGRTRQE